MTAANSRGVTIVLVHAAWADASNWNKIIRILQRKRLQVVAAQIPLTSLSDDVAALKQVLGRIDTPVLLVGHSYGGAVITAVGEDVNVKGLVYIAAMAPDEGETVGQLLHRAAPHASAPALVPDADGLLWMSVEGFAEALAHESPAEDALLMAATQKPISIACVGEHMTRPAWKVKPSWFLVAERDRMIAPETQRFMANRAEGYVVAEEVDHTPLASAPELVAAVIMRAVDATLAADCSVAPQEKEPA